MVHEDAAVRCFIALGSNLGDRLENLKWAAAKIQEHTRIYKTTASPVYETEAHTRRPDEAQPAFLNAVLEVSTSLDPLKLLAFCLDLERERGRVRAAAHEWAPRTLDLDILAYGALSRTSEVLTVPHPRLAERRFVLKPWSDLAPGFWVPAPFQKTVNELLEASPDSSELTQTRALLLD